MSRVLAKKLVRDLAHRKLALLALLVIATIGVASFVSTAGVYLDLEGARASYYADRRVADFTLSVERAPEHEVERLARSPGVRDAHGRVELPCRLLLGEDPHPISGRALSLPAPRRPVLFDVLLRSGGWFSSPDAREVILNSAFAEAHGLRPGSRIRALIQGREHDLLVVGTAMSPEFVYLIPAAGGIAPDPERFAVLYLPERFLREAAGVAGAWNQVLGRVHDPERGALLSTLERLERPLEPYGVTATTPWFDQPSMRFLADELEGLRTSSRIVPLIFLAVAALILNVLLARMVIQQREVIGTLKALGYGKLSISAHFLGHGVLIGLLGGALGALAGVWLQSVLVDVYRPFYELPGLRARLYPALLLQGMGVSVLFATLGTLRGLRSAASLSPADAMRPALPEAGGRILLERLGPLWGWMSFRWKMVARTVLRSPFRSAVSVLAGAVATALIVATLAQDDALWFIMDHEFAAVAREDVRVFLREPVAVEAAREIGLLDGVTSAEAELQVACELSRGPRTRRVGVTGLAPGSRLHVPRLADGSALAVPAAGLVLTRKLAELLDVQAGDLVRLRALTGRRDETAAPVAAIADTYLGLSAYADRRYLSRLLGEEDVANAVLATVRGGEPSPALLAALNERPAVVGLGERRRAHRLVEESFGAAMSTFLLVLILFAGAIAFGSVLNAALVSLSERRREVGTLRVIGYTHGQVAALFARESLVLTALGIALGLWGGVWLTDLLSRAYSTELYRFPMLVRPARMAQAALLMLLFVLLAQLLVRRLVRRLPWLEVLSARE